MNDVDGTINQQKCECESDSELRRNERKSESKATCVKAITAGEHATTKASLSCFFSEMLKNVESSSLKREEL